MRRDATRAVITGCGVMNGLGEDTRAYWAGLAAGRSCVRRWRAKDERIASKVGADFSHFSLDHYLDRVRDLYADRYLTKLPRIVRGTPPGVSLTAIAALQAFAESGIEGTVEPERIAHICAGQNLSLGYYADNLPAFQEHPDDIEPLMGMIALDTDTVGVVSDLLELRGPPALIGGACASGNLAVIAGLDLIRSGRADAVVVTGSPSPYHSMILHSWTLIEAIAFESFNDCPERASRPFDRLREGFVPGEGAGAVVMESLASARRRGARIQAEILGGASASDACRLPKPHVEGQVRAIRTALADANVSADDIDYVNAHATSTPLGDAVEVAALKMALGRRAFEIPVNSTKSMIGHCLTSAGVVELVATLLQMEHGVVHPTINQEDPDPEFDLDFVPNQAREHRVGTAISNSFGFGGINSSIVVGEMR